MGSCTKNVKGLRRHVRSKSLSTVYTARLKNDGYDIEETPKVFLRAQSATFWRKVNIGTHANSDISDPSFFSNSGSKDCANNRFFGKPDS